MTSTERDLRLTIVMMRRATGETQVALAAGIGIRPDQVSRKEKGERPWSLKDLHHIATHYDIAPADLLCGMDHAVRCLPERRRADVVGGTQTTITTTDPTPKGDAR